MHVGSRTASGPLAALALAALLAGAACGPSATPSGSAAPRSAAAGGAGSPASGGAAGPAAVDTRPAALEPIKVSFAADSAVYAPFFIAMEKGYYADQGLAIEMVKAGGGVATPALIAGE